MKATRTRRFQIVLYAAIGFSALFLVWLFLFGRQLAVTHFQGITDAVFAVLALAAGSFLTFCFLPYFQGERRWYSISALLTAVFLAGAVMLWQIPMVTVTV